MTIEGELNAAISDFATKLKGLVLQSGDTPLDLNVVSRLAREGVFLPEYRERGECRRITADCAALEAALSEERIAHGNTLEHLARLQDGPAVIRLNRVISDASTEGVAADADDASEAVA